MANNLSFSNSRFSQHAADLFILLLLFTLLLLLLLLLLMVGMITHDFLRPPFSCSWSATRLISETRTMASSLCFLRRSFHPSRFCTIIVRIRIGINIVRFRPFSSPSTMCFQRKARTPQTCFTRKLPIYAFRLYFSPFWAKVNHHKWTGNHDLGTDKVD